MSSESLPVPVLKYPHWRIVFRPVRFVEERINNIPDLWKIIEQNQVRLRGWYHPHISNSEEERQIGNSWIANWSQFAGHYEYWRLYKSGQYIFLNSVRENTNSEWDAELRKNAKLHFRLDTLPDKKDIPGFFSIDNVIYSVTEIYEYASRLCQAGIYDDGVHVQYSIHGIKGFVLNTDTNRMWTTKYTATSDVFSGEQEYAPVDFVSRSTECAYEVLERFFSFFGWHDLPVDIIRAEQEKFLAGKV